MTAPDVRRYLFSLPRFADRGAGAYRPGLERMEGLMEAMGRPERAFRSVHIAGTNGKGSTASFLAAIATAAGLRTGLHTSPHLFDLSERLRLDGRPAPWSWIRSAVERYRETFDDVRPSFFEATVALSLLYFAEADVDLAVVEVGLGGRLDATNVIQSDLAVITSIGLDHTDLLGDTVGAIAREKAGIIKEGTPVLTAATQPEALEAIREVAQAQTSGLHQLQDEVTQTDVRPTLIGSHLTARTPRRSYPDLHVGLGGAHQRTNALLALRAAEIALGDVMAEADVRRGLREVRRLAGLRGRLDVLSREPLVVADVAHNPDGLAAALGFWQGQARSGGRRLVLFGALRDKALAEMARLLAESAATVIPAPLPGNRALPAGELGLLLARHGARVARPADVETALALFLQEAAPADALLVTGSHLTVAQLPADRLAALSGA